MKQVYLARFGKIYGPYTATEYEALCADGSNEKYSWIWDETKSQWKSLDPAPTLSPQKAHTQTGVGKNLETSGAFQAVCLTPEQTVPGVLQGWTETACELDVSVDRLMLSEGQSVMLHLWDPNSHQAMNISTKLIQRLKSEQGWKLRLRWDSVPEMLK